MKKLIKHLFVTKSLTIWQSFGISLVAAFYVKFGFNVYTVSLALLIGIVMTGVESIADKVTERKRW